MPFDLSRFSVDDMLECNAHIREMGERAESMEEVATRIVTYLRTELVGPDGGPACALVRCFKTHRYGELPPDVAGFARALLPDGHEPTDDLRCLTLLATAGDRPEWNDRTASEGHQAIPLPSEEVVDRSPMIAQLVRELGIEVTAVVRPAPSIRIDTESGVYNVFHVEDALGSPYVPAQEGFVVPYGIRSVVGLGATLYSGDLYAVILFTRVPVPEAVASRFRPVALAVKLALLPFVRGPVFAPTPVPGAVGRPG